MQIAQTIRIAIITISLLLALSFSVITGIYSKKLAICQGVVSTQEKAISELNASLADAQKLAHNIALSYENQFSEYQKVKTLTENSTCKKASELEVIDERSSRDICAYCNDVMGL